MIPESLDGKRLVLFGAGHVGQELLSHFPMLNVLAFADNDVGKQGTDVCGVPVVAADAIAQLDYDLVVITTGWWKSISAQLQALGIPAEKITLPPKSILAIHHGGLPFSHPATKQFATEVMQQIADVAVIHDVPVCLDFGTLLGAYRDGDFIAWDDDIDLVLTEDDFPALLRILPELKAALPALPDTIVNISLFSNDNIPAAVIITFKNASGCSAIIPFEIGILCRVFEGGNFITKGYGTEFIAPQVHFCSYDRISFLGREFNIPHQTESYLRFVYGDWKLPKQNTTLADYPTQEPGYQKPLKTSL